MISADRNIKSLNTAVMRSVGNYDPAEKPICWTYEGSSCKGVQQGAALGTW